MFSDPTLLWSIIAVAGGFAGGRFLFARDTAKEERRRNATKIAGMLRANGLEVLPDVFEDYAVGDYSGLAKSIAKAANLLNDPAAAEALFQKAVERVQAARAKTVVVVNDKS
jgi:hypothetical protein